MKTILVIEDEEAMLRLLTEALTREGFSVLQARDGVRGLELATGSHPDLILLDIVLPKMDGMTMMKKLREEEGKTGKKTPIILLTNLTATDTIMQGVVQDEPSFYLVKSSFKIEDVVAKVKQVLSGSHADHAPAL